MAPNPLVEAMLPLLRATGAVVVAPGDRQPGDIDIEWDGGVVAVVRLPHLDGALDRLLAAAEAEFGAPLAELDREAKQQVVATLHERGAFTVRKSVEDVAARLGVSRFTVYNYLDRVDGETP